jgi:hypothetical protein
MKPGKLKINDLVWIESKKTYEFIIRVTNSLGHVLEHAIWSRYKSASTIELQKLHWMYVMA